MALRDERLRYCALLGIDRRFRCGYSMDRGSREDVLAMLRDIRRHAVQGHYLCSATDNPTPMQDELPEARDILHGRGQNHSTYMRTDNEEFYIPNSVF